MRITRAIAVGGTIAVIGFFALTPGVFAVPSAPDFQALTAPSSCGLELQWNQVGHADLFEFRIGSSAWRGIAGISGEGTHTYLHEQRTPDQSYSYQMRSFANVGGYSTSSNILTRSTPALPNPPAPPNAISLVRWEDANGDGVGDRIMLTWTPVREPASSGFQIFYSSDAGANFSTEGTISLDAFKAASNTWSHSASADAEHRYRIRTYQTASYCAPVGNGTPDDALWVKFSGLSNQLIVPARPASITVTSRNNGTEVKFAWADVASENTYQFQISDVSTFDSPNTKTQIRSAGETETRNTPDSPGGYYLVAPGQSFYYRVRACAGVGNITGCSDYRSGEGIAGRVGPRNLSATLDLSSLSDTTGSVDISWSDEATYKHRTHIGKRVAGVGNFVALTGSPFEPVCDPGDPFLCTYTTSVRDTVARSARYEYEVKFEEVGTNFMSDAAVTLVNLNVNDVLGWAWSSTGLGEGLGWFRAAYDAIASAWGDATRSADSIGYGILADEDSGQLSGSAWNPYAGWLSFNAGDLTGCPAAPCEARFNTADGAVSGWAKLGTGTWVSLSTRPGEPTYGLKYETAQWSPTNKVLTGEAWGGDGVGWIMFSGLPAPDLRSANINPTGTSLTLEFKNPVDYDEVELWQTKSTNPEGVERVNFELNSGVIVPSAKTQGVVDNVVVPNLASNSTYGFFLRATKSSEVAESVIKAGQTQPEDLPRIILNCSSRTTSAITVGWWENISGAHTLSLYRSNTESGVLGGSRTLVASSPELANGSGFYQNINLVPGTYYYLMTSGSVQSNAQRCSTAVESSDAPSLLNVWPVSDRELYVNWKDNAIREHSFVVERIKVTPRDSSLLDPRVATESDSSLRLTWRNDSNRENEMGPFYHSFERSTSSTPFADVDGDGVYEPRTHDYDPSFSEVNQAFPEDTDPESDINTYAWSMGGLEEGTTYTVRTRACSFIRVNLLKGSDPRVESGDPETTVCGGYSTTARASTKPATPSNLKWTSIETGSVSLSFRDNSGGENGFELLRNGTLAHDFTNPSAGKGRTVTYADSGLSSGTTYSYEVRAYRFDPNVPTTRIYSANSNSVSVTTNVTLSVVKSPSAGGTITGNGINCGTTCAAELASGDPVSLTAAPATGYTFSSWTGGQCANPANATCAFTIGADATVTANFATVGGGGGGTVNVAATLNGSPVETSFNFAIESFFSESILVGPGTKNVPWSITGAEEGRYFFYYNSGAPPGGSFSQISWSNSAGNSGGGSPGNMSISSGILPPEGSLSYTVAFVTSSAQKSPLDNFYAKIHGGITGVTYMAEKIADVFRSAFTKFQDIATKVATVFARIEIANVPGGGPIDIDAYFARHVRPPLSPAQYPSVLRDTGLEPNTVYVYRVKAVYTGGETAYALEGAGKTLPSGGTPTSFSGLRICTRNSFCDSVSGTRVVVPPGGPNNTYDPRQVKDGARFEGYGQCRNNNDCRDTHTSRQFFEER